MGSKYAILAKIFLRYSFSVHAEICSMSVLTLAWFIPKRGLRAIHRTASVNRSLFITWCHRLLSFVSCVIINRGAFFLLNCYRFCHSAFVYKWLFCMVGFFLLFKAEWRAFVCIRIIFQYVNVYIAGFFYWNVRLIYSMIFWVFF